MKKDFHQHSTIPTIFVSATMLAAKKAHYDSVLLKSLPKEFVQTMQKSGGTEADCIDFAENTMAVITKDVQAAQIDLQTNVGTECAEMGQEEASAAQGRATATAASAQKDKEAACDANVMLPLDILDTDVPGDYKSNKNFIIAKTACEGAQNVLTIADEDAKIAADTSTTADATAKHLKSECKCRVQKEQATMWTQVQDAASQHRET